MTLDKLIAQLTALSDKGCGAKMDGRRYIDGQRDVFKQIR